MILNKTCASISCKFLGGSLNQYRSSLWSIVEATPTPREEPFIYRLDALRHVPGQGGKCLTENPMLSTDSRPSQKTYSPASDRQASDHLRPFEFKTFFKNLQEPVAPNPHQTKTTQTKPNKPIPTQTKPTQTKPNQTRHVLPRSRLEVPPHSQGLHCHPPRPALAEHRPPLRRQQQDPVQRQGARLHGQDRVWIQLSVFVTS